MRIQRMTMVAVAILAASAVVRAAPQDTKVPPIGEILIIDDTPTGKTVPPRLDAAGRVLAPGYERTGGKSAAGFATDLDALGYTNTIETMATTDAAFWSAFDVVILACGDNESPLDDEDFRADVVDFAAAGGRILLEGGDVGWVLRNDAPFAIQVMHSIDWNSDEGGDLDAADPDHAVMSAPNAIGDGTAFAYEDWGDSDSMVPLEDAQLIAAWSDEPTEGGVIGYDPNPAPEGGQILYYTFDYDKLDDAVAPDLLENSLIWLMTPEVAESSLAGTATLDGETDHSGILIELTPTGLTTVTDAAGQYAFTDIYGGDYTVTASKEGWHDQTAEATVASGGDLAGVDLTLSPVLFGEIIGILTDEATEDPVGGTLRLLDAATATLVDTTESDPVTGEFAFDPHPYGDYILEAWAPGYLGETAPIDLYYAWLGQDFQLAAALGTFLLIDDHTAGTKAVDTMADDLYDLGYDVHVETPADTDPLLWGGYDLLLVSSGDRGGPLDEPGFPEALIDYVQMDGPLFIEGGEIGFCLADGGEFSAVVLHASGFIGEPQSDLTIIEPAHAVASTPNTLGTMSLSYSLYNDADGIDPLPDATMIGGWDGETSASIIGYDPTPSPVGGQILYCAFNYLALDETGRVDLLENAVVWLTVDEPAGTGSISGHATLANATDHSGVLVELSPGDVSVITGADGAYTFAELYGQTYTIQASCAARGTETVTLDLAEGEAAVDIDLRLFELDVSESCNAPSVAIPDDDESGLSDVINMPLSATCTVSDVEVYLDVTHTYQGDLLATLISPTGTTVVLHNRTGTTTDDILGWYPTELTPAESLDTFVGEDAGGDWTLFISDTAGGDTGTLNEWCLKVYYVDRVPVAAGAMTASPGRDGVRLIWNYETELVDGFHIYRRIGDGTLRLTDDPLSDAAGRIEYLDTPEGLAPGTRLHYSYALVVDGIETGRGAEVEVVFDAAPQRFVLHRCYPNPFNPETTIAFELPEPGRVDLRVVDLGGRVVRTLVDETLPAAVHRRAWDGTDDRGRRLASGTYFFRLSCGERSAVEKAVLVK